MSLQPFKANDPREAQFRDCFLEALDPLGIARDDFFEGAYECHLLGEVLFALGRSPVADAIGLENFRRTFYAIHNYFERPGTFEFYLAVFRAIWGESVEVEFVVPSPGVLEINVEALDLEVYDLVARSIVDNAYVREEIIDQPDGDNIAVRAVFGVRTQDEFNKLLRELAPAGIYVVGTLTVAP